MIYRENLCTIYIKITDIKITNTALFQKTIFKRL